MRPTRKGPHRIERQGDGKQTTQRGAPRKHVRNSVPSPLGYNTNKNKHQPYPHHPVRYPDTARMADTYRTSHATHPSLPLLARHRQKQPASPPAGEGHCPSRRPSSQEDRPSAVRKLEKTSVAPCEPARQTQVGVRRTAAGAAWPETLICMAANIEYSEAQFSRLLIQCEKQLKNGWGSCHTTARMLLCMHIPSLAQAGEGHTSMWIRPGLNGSKLANTYVHDAPPHPRTTKNTTPYDSPPHTHTSTHQDTRSW